MIGGNGHVEGWREEGEEEDEEMEGGGGDGWWGRWMVGRERKGEWGGRDTVTSLHTSVHISTLLCSHTHPVKFCGLTEIMVSSI